MNKLTVMNRASSMINRAGAKIQKHSPEILIIGGVIGTVASAVMACKATTKLESILEEHRAKVEDIHTAKNDEEIREALQYTDEDGAKDLTIVYAQTCVKVVKLYAPAVAMGALSIGAILTSNNILRKRNVALAAAYATIDKSFKDYRNRVVERFGEAVDRELRYNIKAEKVTEKRTNPETGKEEKVKTTKFVVNPADISGYARFFEQYTKDENGNTIVNRCWTSDNEQNIMFLKAQERYANDILVSRGRLFLNEVYRMLGLPETKAGQIVGWVYDPDNTDPEEKRDNYVSFGMYNDNLSYSDYANGFDPAILLDFNVDGNIWELMN